MKVYEPIEGLLGRRRRPGRRRVTFGLFGIVGLGLVLYWALLIYPDRSAQARTDRIISLSAPDFTEVLSEAARDDARQRDGLDAEQTPLRAMLRDAVDGVMQPNQTLFVAMTEAGVERQSIQRVVDALDGTFNFRRARPGDRWEARLDEEGRISRFRYSVSAEEVYEASRRSDGGYDSGRLEVPTEIVVVGFGGTVLTSVYDAVAALGEGTSLATRFMEVFAWDFDFSRDARPGDTFRLVVEKVLLEGVFLRYGRVLAAEYNRGEQSLQAFAFTHQSGQTEYYSGEGEALRRRFLQAPLSYRRISSTFTRRRYHPILRRYRAHLGVDYAADTGTPIWAIADGRVTFAGVRGGNGNLIVIAHDGDYETRAAHLSRFADGMRRGREVRQGEVIGYVGSTGLSTGPHLHFGVRHRGEDIDPLSLRATRGRRIPDYSREAFEATVERLSSELSAIAISPVDVSSFAAHPAESPEDLPSDFGILDPEDAQDTE